MSTTRTQIKSLPKYGDRKKCGEITVSADRLFEISCIFCENIVLELAAFVKHVKILHFDELQALFYGCCVAESTFCSTKVVHPNELMEIKVVPSILEGLAEQAGKDPLEEQLNAGMEEETATVDLCGEEIKNKLDESLTAIMETGADEDTSLSGPEDNDNGNTSGDFCLNKKLREIAGIYKNYPCLWDLDHEQNRDRSRKNEAEKELLQLINQELNLNLNFTELKGRLSYLRRIYAKEKRRRFQAEDSKKLFKPKHKLYDMLQYMEHSIGPFKCEKCSEYIPSHDKFRVHQAAHVGVKPFVCKICNKGWNTLGNLQVHMRRHTGEAKFLCAYCGKGCPSSFDLDKHLNSHPEACHFVCDICGKSFRRQRFLNRHKIEHDPKNKSYKCSICSKAYFAQHKFREHMNSHLNIRSCICQICGKGFYAKKTLYQHIKTHKEKKSFTCTICRKDYARPASYYSHMKAQHSLEKDDINS